MTFCPALAPHSGFLSNVFQFIDCHARTIGAEGYRALAAPGSSFSIVLGALLSLFVAIFGYRMLLGHIPTVREGVLAMVKLGLVLALATGWTAYRTLIYDVAFDGPAELARDIGRPAALPGADGIAERLQLADHALVQLAVAGTGEAGMTEAARSAENLAPPAFGGFEPFALGMARTFYLTGAIAAFGSVRLIAGLLLALGPFFIAFLLFDGTRGLFEGWLRVLGGAALGALGTTVALGVELALIEPRLADWLARRAAGLPAPGAAVELLAITLVFALALLAMLVASARVARGFAFPPLVRAASSVLARGLRGQEVQVGVLSSSRIAVDGEPRRAVEVAEAVAASQRRENVGGPPAPSASAALRVDGQGSRPGTAALQPVPLGHSMRRTRTRVSSSSARRDRRA